jgi:hypothetical protein
MATGRRILALLDRKLLFLAKNRFKQRENSNFTGGRTIARRMTEQAVWFSTEAVNKVLTT